MVTTVVNTGSQSSLLRCRWAGVGLEGVLGRLLRAGVGEAREGRTATDLPSGEADSGSPSKQEGSSAPWHRPSGADRHRGPVNRGVCLRNSKAHMYP